MEEYLVGLLFAIGFAVYFLKEHRNNRRKFFETRKYKALQLARRMDLLHLPSDHPDVKAAIAYMLLREIDEEQQNHHRVQQQNNLGLSSNDLLNLEEEQKISNCNTSSSDHKLNPEDGEEYLPNNSYPPEVEMFMMRSLGGELDDKDFVINRFKPLIENIFHKHGAPLWSEHLVYEIGQATVVGESSRTMSKLITALVDHDLLRYNEEYSLMPGSELDLVLEN